MRNGWKVRPIFQRDPLQAEYLERMAKEMRAAVPPQPRPKEQFASAQRILDRPESEDEAWQNRPLPTWEQAGAKPWTKDPYEMSDEERDDLVGARKLTPDEIEVVRRLRQRGRGHTFGDAVSEGGSSVSSEDKDRAVNAFMYSPGKLLPDLTEEELRQLYKPVPFPLPQNQQEPPQIEADSFKEGVNPRRFIPRWIWELLGRQW